MPYQLSSAHLHNALHGHNRRMPLAAAPLPPHPPSHAAAPSPVKNAFASVAGLHSLSTREHDRSTWLPIVSTVVPRKYKEPELPQSLQQSTLQDDGASPHRTAQHGMYRLPMHAFLNAHAARAHSRKATHRHTLLAACQQPPLRPSLSGLAALPLPPELRHPVKLTIGCGRVPAFTLCRPLAASWCPPS
jgi:hypothetical protein